MLYLYRKHTRQDDTPALNRITMKSTVTYLIVAICLMLAVFMPTSAQSLQVTINTTPSKANIFFRDSEGRTIGVGRTPVSIMVEPGKEYSYQIRHQYCYADSGYVTFDYNLIDTTLVLRPYTVNINWDVTPSEADVTITDQRDKNNEITTHAKGSTRLDGGPYTVTLHQKDYRRHIERFRFKADTTITLSHRMQYCPPRLTIALSGGLSPHGGMPLGITAAYGGVHGGYVRAVKTWFNLASGDDFSEHVLVDALYNPYSDVRSEYMSVVAGYQYYTPWNIYVQVGLGYGTLRYNWLSAEDDKRHIFAPDNMVGGVLDLGAGYPIGKFYVGAALQALFGSSESDINNLPPVTGLLNFGIIL